MRDDFAIFILSHGRSDNVKTLATLNKCNYTGKWYIIIDNEDSTAQEYYNRFGEEHIIMFDKLAVSKTFDTGDNFDNRKTIVYARNACFPIAKKLGITYFMELDDDYLDFRYRYPEGDKLASVPVNNFNELLDVFITFLDKTNAKTVAFAQGGDLIGGLYGCKFKQGLLRKAMNTFIFNVNNPLTFLGRINEDVNSYTYYTSIGELLFTVTAISMDQVTTQQGKSGMTDVYLDGGTYLKSFYTLLYAPSMVKLYMLGPANKRIHHKVKWENCAPKIMSSKYKK